MNTRKITGYGLAILTLGSTALTLVGCSTDENPITPDKMLEIRKKQNEERANFHPDTTQSPGTTK